MIDQNLKELLNKYILVNFQPIEVHKDYQRKKRIIHPNITKKRSLSVEAKASIMPCACEAPFEVENSFQKELFRLIDEKNISDPDLYNKCFIDRKLFSKIRSDEYYKPSKKTAVLLCLGLELDLEATLDLLAKAGYTLSKAIKADVIVRYFIEEKNYDIRLINDTLFDYDEPLLINCE